MDSIKILVVDDESRMRKLVKDFLSKKGYIVLEAGDGEEAVDIFMNNKDIGLIILDVMMPKMDGWETCKEIRKFSQVPIIMLTAKSDERDELLGFELGIDEYITKPFSTKLLLARVFKLIEQRDKLREKFSSDLSMVRPVICTTDKDKEFTDKLTRIVEEQLENPDFTVDDFASMMALGRTIFYRKVKGVTGYAPKEYLRVMRMKKAAELLLKTDVTVAEVAYQVGINDPFYFSKCFKAQFGVSPSAYQKNKDSVSQA